MDLFGLTCWNHYFLMSHNEIGLVVLRNEMTNHSKVDKSWTEEGILHIVWSCYPIIMEILVDELISLTT